MTDIFPLDFKATESGAVHVSIQDTAHGQNAVANGFCFEPSRWKSPPPFARRIGLQSILARLTTLLIGRRCKNQSMHMFQRPVVIHQLASHPVQQFRMCRCDTGFTEVTRCRDKPLAKVKLPQAIHNDSGCQRVLFRCDPVRQCQPTLLFRRGFVDRQLSERGNCARFHLFTFRQWFATKQTMSRPGLLKGSGINLRRGLRL